ncbi:MAG: prolyl oligopeptidase family serine peptidase [Candidatus Saccharimonadales bacterium]
MKYPITFSKLLVETILGHRINDNYRWLEDGQKSKVKKWVEAQNKLTDQVIPKSLRTQLEKQLMRSYKFPSTKAPEPYNGSYFWWERQPEEEQGVLYVRNGLRGKKNVLVNPNKLSQASGHIVSLDYWFPSRSGQYLAYGTSHGGDELSVLKVLNVRTGKDLETVAENASWTSVAWMPDETGFYYTKHPVPGSVPKGEERYHQKAYYHQLSSVPSSDNEVFGKGRPKEDMLRLELSVDGRFLVISVSQNWERNDLYLYDTRLQKVTDLLVGYDAQFGLAFTDKRAFLCTNYKASNSRILSADQYKLPTNPNQWENFIPERKHKLEWYQITKDQILAVYLIDAGEKAVSFDLKGKETGKLPMPDHASLLRIGARREEDEFFYEFASFTTPGVTCHYSPTHRKITEFDRMGSLLNESNYLVKQKWFKSKDGTKVPMFIVHHKSLKLNSKNPTILYGYGGFESSVTPHFLRAFVPWLEKGGIYASANIRGGGELGKTWHTGGIKKNKQKSYDDFTAAAEHLISKKYTSNKHLGILGASNGGLLVSVVGVQRPELFKAIVSRVPLADMVRFPNLLIASRWIAEYGDPTKPEDLSNILKFSPYHNVKKDVEYPAFLFTTADNDTRVDPMHARKMTALLQGVNSNNPILLYTESSAGHMGSITMSRFYRDQARVLAFFIKQLGLENNY